MMVLLSLTMSGCGGRTATASAAGYRSNIRIEVSVDSDGRLSVRQVSHNETPGIGDYGVTATVARMNELQSVAVDVVSGATVSSLAAIAAAEKAVSKLRSDAHRFLSEPAVHASEYRTLHYDIVIIGAGGAGLTAAIEAAPHASVLVVERMGIPGGSTARSDGKIQAMGSNLQEKFWEIDSAAAFAGYLYSYADPSLGSYRQLELAEHSADNILFLENAGVKFSPSIYPAYEGQSPRRIHQVASDGSAAGGLLVKPLVDKALSLGVDFLYDTLVTEITTEVDGIISGIRAYNALGDQFTVLADAVIIATGGFAGNSALLDQYGLRMDRTLVSPGDTGDGLFLARSVGANIFSRGALIATLEDLGTGLFDTKGLIVDPTGARLGNEAAEKQDLSAELFARGFSYAWLITDGEAYQQAVRNGLNTHRVVTAETLGELSRKLGTTSLFATVANYNRSCEERDDPMYGKDRKYLSEIGQAPFCAVKLTLLCTGTLGGIVTNNRCQILDVNGNIIPHLYAAGEVMNGSYFISGLPGAGVSLAQVVETGRLAGKNAVLYSILIL